MIARGVVGEVPWGTVCCVDGCGRGASHLKPVVVSGVAMKVPLCSKCWGKYERKEALG